MSAKNYHTTVIRKCKNEMQTGQLTMCLLSSVKVVCKKERDADCTLPMRRLAATLEARLISRKLICMSSKKLPKLLLVCQAACT